MKNKIYQKIVLCTTLLAVVCLSILFFMQFIRNVSVGADNSRMKLEVNLDKYINFRNFTKFLKLNLLNSFLKN